MEQPDDLARAVYDLAQRVGAIEQRLGLIPHAAAPAAPAVEPRPPATALPLTAVGRLLLGLAGAYLLRAIDAGVGAGLLYALGWLVWAARTPAGRRFETALHSLTAALVIAPLVWEATMRFHSLSAWPAGAILLFFTVFGLTVSWRKNLLIVATIAILTGAGTAAALLMATHDVVPFTVVFLAIGAAVEMSACLNHWLSERWLAAAAADCSVLLVTWLVTNARGVPPQYAPISHQALLAVQVSLLVIYLSSTIVRTLLRHLTVTGFEIAQCIMAFAVVLSGGITFAIGIVALACSAACYAISPRLKDRNLRTYSTFGLLLCGLGCWVVFPIAAPAIWAVLAAAFAASRRDGLVPHSVAYLLLAGAASGTLAQVLSLLVGSGTAPTITAAALGAIAWGCYALVARGGHPAVRIATAAIAVWFAAGIAAGLLMQTYHGIFGVGASHAYCATLRTGTATAAALLLALAGARWKRVEFAHLVYPAMILGAYRLVAEDLRQERKVALFLSLLVYGGALMLLPRFRSSGSPGPERS